MKKIIMAAALMSLISVVHGAESVGEKAQATSNDAGRSVKKGVNRVKESVCMESDAKCLAEKAKHRALEGKDYTKDKVSEIKNKIDNK